MEILNILLRKIQPDDKKISSISIKFASRWKTIADLDSASSKTSESIYGTIFYHQSKPAPPPPYRLQTPSMILTLAWKR